MCSHQWLRVETVRLRLETTERQLETNQHTSRSRDLHGCDSRSPYLNSRPDSRPPWLRLKMCTTRGFWLRLETTCSRVETIWFRLDYLILLLGRTK
ncbi:hypothetical protein Hanom_Chr02g00101161 [Helianthus anomalus]